ncbi:MFS transporter [Streptomyces anulatus]|uniref:MFS transporter n=1 Tax=Streptomyces anulatus TaxID=1892 RepID=UPI0012FEE9D4|nr:MFS transporter [Streptomyces anulatus]
MKRMSRKSALARTGFFRLWSAESASMVGSEVTMFALPLVAVFTLDSSVWEMGLLSAAGSLAVLLFGLSAGVWADQYERRAVMLVSNIVRFLVLLLVPVLYWTDRLTLAALMVVSFVVGAMTLLFDSAMSAYLPRLVPKESITQANSWIQATESVGRVAGPGIAGTIVQLLGAPVALLIDSFSYLISSFSLASLPKAAPERQQDAPRESHRAAISSGLKLLWGNSVLRPLVLAAAHFNLFTSMYFALFILYAVRALGFSPFLLGVVTMSGGIAGLVGSAAATRLAARFGLGPTMICCYAVPGAAGLLVPAAGSFGKTVALICVALTMFLWLFSVVILLILGMSLRQQLVQDAYLGRVSATFRFVAWGVEPVGALLGGALGSSALGLRGTLILATVGIMPSALWPLFSRVRKIHDPLSELPHQSDSAEREVAS